ncbi:AfsR/SARP family transcriptional regulator [Prauserella shujinwangii]|nr:AfsR/SARP family transcriptional regulator [Prauserella shujinwangii]
MLSRTGDNIVPSALKPRQVIALLVLRRNSVVRTSELIDELWEENPPVSAMTTLQTYIYKLRKLLLENDFGGALRTRAGGYCLTLPDSAVDLHRFEQLADQGRAALDGGDRERASALLGEALSLWRGPALADVTTGSLLSAYVTRLEEIRFRTLEMRIQTDLHLERHNELVSELKSLVVTHPLHEQFHLSLMTALVRSGRRHDALAVYRRLRENMIDELGLEPGQELQRLHQSLLSSAPSPQARAAPPSSPSAPPPPDRQKAPRPAPPAQLPPDIADFTGRKALLAALVQVVSEPGTVRTATPIVVISGMPGVGKSALATHLAHQVRQRFPGGQLHVDLRGSTRAPRDPAPVLSHLLRALGVPGDEIADGAEERANQLRSATAGRRVLVVLDDAASEGQVRPLLPSNPHCSVIITSRHRLYGLAGVSSTLLDPLTRGEGVEFLGRIIGPERVREDPSAIERLADASDGHPVALRGLGSRLASLSTYSAGALADEVSRSDQVLEEFAFGDHDVRACFDSSYHRLDAAQQGFLRLLSALPVPDFTAAAVAELLGRDETVTRRLLEHCHEHHFLRIVPGPGRPRYTFPRLARAYVRERLLETLRTYAEADRVPRQRQLLSEPAGTGRSPGTSPNSGGVAETGNRG